MKWLEWVYKVVVNWYKWLIGEFGNEIVKPNRYNGIEGFEEVSTGKWHKKIAKVSVGRWSNIKYWLIDECWYEFIEPKYSSLSRVPESDHYYRFSRPKWKWRGNEEWYVNWFDGEEYIGEAAKNLEERLGINGHNW